MVELDKIGEITGGLNLPSLSVSPFIKYLLIFLISMLVVALLCVGVYYGIIWLKFNKRIVIWKEFNGRVIPVVKTKGMLGRIGKAGDLIMMTRKLGKTLPRPTIMIDKNVFWYFERSDGEYINFGLANFDEKMKAMGAKYVDEDMRLQRLAIQKNLFDRLTPKKGFLEKYGFIMMFVLVIMLVSIVQIIQFKYFRDNISAASNANKQVESNLKAIEAMSSSIDNLVTRIGGISDEQLEKALDRILKEREEVARMEDRDGDS